MRCKEYREDRILYIYNELEGKRKKKFEKHLLSCPCCKEYIGGFKGVLSVYKKLPGKEPSLGMKEMVLGRVRKRQPSRIRWGIRWTIPALAAATAVLLILILPVHRADLWENGISEAIEGIEEEIYFIKQYEEEGYTMDMHIQSLENDFLLISY